LVLNRHRDESIMIGDDIVITVVGISGDKVKLGISAPIEIAVHRKEVHEAIRRENRARESAPPPPGACPRCCGMGCRACAGSGKS
jgi:carbon storage regulator